MKLKTSRADRKKLKAKPTGSTGLIGGLWYPKSSELQLPDVPVEAREQVRTRLEPVLANLRDYDGIRVGVKKGMCWEVAQAIMLTANDAGFTYVEGAWQHPDGKRYASPVPHGWVNVDGHRVDLINEFFLKFDNSGKPSTNHSASIRWLK